MVWDTKILYHRFSADFFLLFLLEAGYTFTAARPGCT